MGLYTNLKLGSPSLISLYSSLGILHFNVGLAEDTAMVLTLLSTLNAPPGWNNPPVIVCMENGSFVDDLPIKHSGLPR